MRNLMIFTGFLIGIILCLPAQSIQGSYGLQSSSGNIVLNLRETAGNSILGNMTAANGLNLGVQGRLEGSDISGTLSGNNGNRMFFEASVEGNEMYFSLYPMDQNGQVITAQGQTYTLSRLSSGSQGHTQNTLSPQTFPAKPNVASPSFSSPSNHQPMSQPSSQGYQGTFSGNINGTPATMSLQAQGNQFSGNINAGGYMYNIQGRANGIQAQGTLFDPQTQAQMAFNASLNEPNLILNIQAQNNFGQIQQFSLQFSRGAQGGESQYHQQGGNTAQNQGYGNQSTANDGKQRDPRLVGNWIQSDSYTSGDYSFASQRKLIVMANGIFYEGDSQMAGGGPGVSGSTGPGSAYQQGQWYTQGNILYANSGQGWIALAKYYVEAGRMMFTFGDGSKQIWYKQQ